MITVHYNWNEFIAKVKDFGLWFYKNVLLKYWELKYNTTLMHLARLTLLVLAKEVVVPIVFWICVFVNAVWPNAVFHDVLDQVKVVCIPSYVEVIIASLAVVVLLIVVRSEYSNEKRQVDVLDKIYIPYTDKMLEFLDIDNYCGWTSSLAISGNTMISERQVDNLHAMSLYLKSRIKHKGFERLDELYGYLAVVSDDIARIINYYGDFTRPDNVVTINKFYKTGGQYNPNYHQDLKLFRDILFLISDLTFEQTRLCNLILKTIREKKPDYQALLGILYTDNVIEHNIYKCEEENDISYNGLDAFMEERENRSCHFGKGKVKLAI